MDSAPWPEWELEAIADVSDRWEIDGTEAENFLVNVGVLH